jgi:hypothetical protein
MRILSFRMIGVILVILLNSCAQIGTLTGGEKDAKGPKLVASKSSKSGKTQFSDKDFTLAFDEWIELKNPTQEVLVSPPLEYKPKLQLKGKSVKVLFDSREVLKENTTYTVNFGNAVVDYHEANPAENLKFVFSTGNFLDSMFIVAKVIDPLTNKPVSSGYCILHKNGGDSVLRKEKPFYFSSINKTGGCRIENIAPGKYDLFYLDDKDGNYKFNGKESVGFLDTLVSLNTPIQDTLTLFSSVQPQPWKRIGKSADRYGRVKLEYNHPISRVRIDANIPIVTTIEKDSVFLWYNPSLNKEPFTTILNFPFGSPDTLVFNPNTVKISKVNSKELTKVQVAPSGSNPPLSPIKFISNQPWESINQDSIRLLNQKDSLILGWEILSEPSDPKVFYLNYPWSLGNYKVKFGLGSLSSANGLTSDSTSTFFSIANPKSLGSLKAIFNVSQKNAQWIGELKKENELVSTFILRKGAEGDVFEIMPSENEVKRVGFKEIKKGFSPDGKWSSSTSKKGVVLFFPELTPGQYTFRIIEDLDRNFEWTGSIYDLKQKEEKIFISKPQVVRGGWEKESTIEVKF